MKLRNRQNPSHLPGPTAFVLNVSYAGLGAMRSLGRAGVPIVGVDPDPNHAGFVSRYGRSLESPHPVHEPDALAEFLLDLGADLDEPGILSPASDAFVLFVSRYRDQLSTRFRYALPSATVMEAAVDKRGLYELAASAGYHHAATHYPRAMDDVVALRHELDYPVYIKPYHSHLWQVAFPEVGKGIKVFSPGQLVEVFGPIFDAGLEVMVQTIIQGPAANVCTVYVYLDAEGEPLGLVTTRKIRQFPMEFGRGSLAETVHEPDLAAYGLEFFRRIGYRGFGTIEFKRDDRDGLLKVTDLNPRWVKPTALPVRAGVDFPLIHYLDLAGRPPAPQLEFRAGVRWIDAVGDLHTSLAMMRSRELTPWGWVSSLRGVRSAPGFAADDLRPFLHELDYGRRLLRAPASLLRRR